MHAAEKMKRTTIHDYTFNVAEIIRQLGIKGHFAGLNVTPNALTNPDGVLTIRMEQTDNGEY